MARGLAKPMGERLKKCDAGAQRQWLPTEYCARGSDALASDAVASEEGGDLVVPLLFRPGERPGPWLRIGLHRIGAAIQKEAHQHFAAPSTCPAQRRALQQVIAEVEPSPGIQGGSCGACAGSL